LLFFPLEALQIVGIIILRYPQIVQLLFDSGFLENIRTYIYQNQNVSIQEIISYLQILAMLSNNPEPNHFTFDGDFFFNCVENLPNPLPPSLIILLYNLFVHLSDEEEREK